MKEKDEELDKLFRKGLEDPVNEPAYREADWDAMEQMLDKRKKRPAIIYWLPLSSAAALILIFLGWLFFRPVVVKHQQNEPIVKAQHPVSSSAGSDQNKKDEIKGVTGTSGAPTRQEADSERQKAQAPANYAKNPDVSGHGRKSKSFLPLSAGDGRRDVTGYPQNQNNAVSQQPVTTLAATTQKKPVANDTTTIQNKIANSTLAIANNALPIDTNNKQVAKNANSEVAKIAKVTLKPHPSFRPQFALGVIASSDLNGVNSSFQQSKIGGNFGLEFSAGLSKKWTVTTGATYDIKPYLTGIGNYHTSYVFPTEPTSVSANCRMLEIPVNVSYQVYNKHNNKLSIGTGLSSYFMLREDYTFNYGSSYNTGPTGFSVINKNRNIFSIVNLDATYIHQVNSKVGILIQPYLKVPLSNVGESQVRLQTSGVALGLSWNLNSLTKK